MIFSCGMSFSLKRSSPALACNLLYDIRCLAMGQTGTKGREGILGK